MKLSSIQAVLSERLSCCTVSLQFLCDILITSLVLAAVLDFLHCSLSHSSIAGVGQTAGGPARLHRPSEHPGEQVLQHDAEQQRGGEAVGRRRNIDQLSVIDFVHPKPKIMPHTLSIFYKGLSRFFCGRP